MEQDFQSRVFGVLERLAGMQRLRGRGSSEASMATSWICLITALAETKVVVQL